jgi:hypothetical protein
MDFIYLLWNRTKKSLVIALYGAGRRLRGREDGGDVNNIQWKPNWNCHYEFPHNEYILIKILKRIKKVYPYRLYRNVMDDKETVCQPIKYITDVRLTIATKTQITNRESRMSVESEWAYKN